MFSSDCRESQENQVDLKDIKYDYIVALLQILNHEEKVISDNNVRGLLVLAYRYDVQVLVSKCEYFLVSSKTIAIMDKLRIAEMYRLTKLQETVLNDLSERYIPCEKDKFIKGVENDPSLSDETKKAAIQELLIDKMSSIGRTAHLARCKNRARRI